MKEYPEDRKKRIEGEKYGRKYAMEFVLEHLRDMTFLIGTYADDEAESLFLKLREMFWSNEWKPRETAGF